MSKLLGCACGFKELERIPRTFWMRWIPFVRFYRCNQCQAQFLASKRKVDAARRLSVVYVPHSAVGSVPTSKAGEAAEQASPVSHAQHAGTAPGVLQKSTNDRVAH